MLQHIQRWLRFPRSSSYGTSFVAPTPKPSEAEIEAALIRQAAFDERMREMLRFPGRRRIAPLLDGDLYWIGENRDPVPVTTINDIPVPESTEVMN